MSYREELLRDDYSIKGAKKLQLKYRKIVESEQGDYDIKKIGDLTSVVGVDISYYKREKFEFGVACAVVWDIKKEIIEGKSFAHDVINFPYKTGFLGFRECRLITKSISKLTQSPDLIMCDGHGIIHPRSFGEAVQLGYALNIPCMGIAKKSYIGYSNWKKLDRDKGNYTPVWTKKSKKDIANDIIGYAVCLSDRSKPVFISIGYKITLDAALEICLATSLGHRQPEPLYLADHLSREEVKKKIAKLSQEYDFKVT